ncbi:MAG: C25 family peptidase propeptide domain-containing protein, partial [Bacteroidota bacterium]
MDSSLVPVYKIDAAAYARDAFYPASQLVVEPSFTLRQQRISTIRLFPYQYNPAARTLRRIVNAKIDVQFVQKTGNLFARGAASRSDPYFEHIYKSLIANYEEAKQWRSPIASSASRVSDSTRNWFQTGRDYYRISIASDGWYRVTKADIAVAGGNPDLLDVPSVKIFGRGVEVPVLVRPDSTIEFFAMRKYGDSTYYDAYTDTNIYWLTWGGTPGLR